MITENYKMDITRTNGLYEIGKSIRDKQNMKINGNWYAVATFPYNLRENHPTEGGCIINFLREQINLSELDNKKITKSSVLVQNESEERR